jgi:hypothetical protein
MNVWNTMGHARGIFDQIATKSGSTAQKPVRITTGTFRGYFFMFAERNPTGNLLSAPEIQFKFCCEFTMTPVGIPTGLKKLCKLGILSLRDRDRLKSILSGGGKAMASERSRISIFCSMPR